jgi:hypothetical protein
MQYLCEGGETWARASRLSPISHRPTKLCPDYRGEEFGRWQTGGHAAWNGTSLDQPCLGLGDLFGVASSNDVHYES